MKPTPHIAPAVPLDLLAKVVLGRAEPASLGGRDLRGLAPLVASLTATPPPGTRAADWERTRASARRLAATHLVVEETAHRALEVLHGAGHHPVVLKGLAMSELYPRGEMRPTGDVDLLVHPDRFADARSALTEAGWEPVVTGPWAEHYLEREGYCWQAVRPDEAVLELHYRLWGSVASRYGADVVESAVSTGSRRRPCPEDLIVIAASHAWRQPSPRRGADFVDVALVLDRETTLDPPRLLHRLEISGQHLPVALCLRTLGESLPEDVLEWLTRDLVPRLRGPESRLYRRTEARDPDRIRWPSIRLAMLRAGRPSRLGWRAVWRRLWPHPVTLGHGTEGRPLWQRRLLHAMRRSG